MDQTALKLKTLSECDPGKIFYYKGRKCMITHVLSRKYKMFIIVDSGGTYCMRISSDCKTVYYDPLVYNSEETKLILNESVDESDQYRFCDEQDCNGECIGCGIVKSVTGRPFTCKLL